MHNARNAGDADQHGDDRQQEHGVDLVHKTPDVDREAGREEQRRQEQGQEHFGADLELVEADERVAEDAEIYASADDPRAQEAQTHAGYGQEDRVRQPESLRERHQHTHDGQDYGDRQQGVESVCHLV